MAKIFETRDYQERIHTKSTEYLKTKKNGIAHTLLIESPTGSGKTVMSMRLCKWLEDNYGHKIGWIAHRRELLNQALATNDEFFQVNDINPISMFTRTPEQYKDCTVVVVDECLPGDACLHIIHDGKKVQASIEAVVKNNFGTHVLSRNKDKLEYNRILNRTPMGRKEIYEVVIKSGDKIVVLPITAEGRVFADNEYRKVTDLKPNMVVESLASCCHKYVGYEQKQETLPSPTGRKVSERAKLQMRMRQESEMVPVHQKVQNLLVQSQPTPTSENDYLTTGADYQRDSIGRREYRLHKESNHKSSNGESQATPETLPNAAAVYLMAEERIRFDNFSKDLSLREQRFWKSNMLLFHSISSEYFQNRFNDLSTEENCNKGIFRYSDGSKFSDLVDGRRISKRDVVNSFVHNGRASNHHRLVSEKVSNNSENFMGQKSEIALLEHQSTLLGQIEGRHQTPYDPIDDVQTGSIIEIRATGQYTETFDIGVNKVENFYADGILVHNCQHDASASCAILHQVIKPEIIIGLTATPYRTDRAQLSFQKVIRDAGIRQLIREGYLAQFDQWILDCEWSPENVARAYIQDMEKWGKSVIYFLTIDHANQCTELLKQHGVRAELITGKSPRGEILKRFSAGETDVLCNVAVLTEGFDEPTLKTVFVRPGSKGPTVQTAGRALRKHPTTPIVNIVQNNKTKYPFTRHACAHNQYIRRSNGWRSIDPRNLKKIFQQQITKMTRATVEIPKFLRGDNRNIFAVE